MRPPTPEKFSVQAGRAKGHGLKSPILAAS